MSQAVVYYSMKKSVPTCDLLNSSITKCITTKEAMLLFSGAKDNCVIFPDKNIEGQFSIYHRLTCSHLKSERTRLTTWWAVKCTS